VVNIFCRYRGASLRPDFEIAVGYFLQRSGQGFLVEEEALLNQQGFFVFKALF